MIWRKLGVVWLPRGHLWWARKYASCPTPIAISDDRVRVFIQCRDNANVGRVGYVDLDAYDPMRVIAVAPQPVLDIGAPGTFDDQGVFQTSVTRLPDGRLFMYYVGFEICHRIRYRLLTGLAISDDDGERFFRVKSTPVLERSDDERYIRGGPFVRYHEGKFRMWYVGGNDWIEIDGKPMPCYDIRYVESDDGIHWPNHGEVVLPITDPDEHGFGRPYVIDGDHGAMKMFYSIRKKSLARYRMGYAESIDGRQWVRKDAELGLDVSPEGWDSESVEYAAVFSSRGNTWMLYNGNDFGATGFGLAILESGE